MAIPDGPEDQDEPEEPTTKESKEEEPDNPTFAIEITRKGHFVYATNVIPNEIAVSIPELYKALDCWIQAEMTRQLKKKEKQRGSSR